MRKIEIEVPENILEHLDDNAKDYEAVIVDLLRRYRHIQNRTGKKHSILLQKYFNDNNESNTY